MLLQFIVPVPAYCSLAAAHFFRNEVGMFVFGQGLFHHYVYALLLHGSEADAITSCYLHNCIYQSFAEQQVQLPVSLVIHGLQATQDGGIYCILFSKLRFIRRLGAFKNDTTMKTWTTLTLGLCILGLTSKAQENIGLYYSPTLDIDNADYYWFNYSVGLKSNIRINDKFLIRAGLGYEHDKYDRSEIPRLLDRSPFADYIDVQLIKTDCHLRLDFLAKDKKISFYTLAGPTVNTSIREKADPWYYEAQGNKKLRVYNLLLTGGLGFDLTIMDKLTIDIEPTYSTPIWTNRTAAAIAFTYRLGVSIGLAYNLVSSKVTR